MSSTELLRLVSGVVATQTQQQCRLNVLDKYCTLICQLVVAMAVRSVPNDVELLVDQVASDEDMGKTVQAAYNQAMAEEEEKVEPKKAASVRCIDASVITHLLSVFRMLFEWPGRTPCSTT